MPPPSTDFPDATLDQLQGTRAATLELMRDFSDRDGSWPRIVDTIEARMAELLRLPECCGWVEVDI